MVTFVCDECGCEGDEIFKIVYESDAVKYLCENCKDEAIETAKDASTQFDWIYKISLTGNIKLYHL